MIVVLSAIGVAGLLFAVVVVSCARDRRELKQGHEDEEDDRG